MDNLGSAKRSNEINTGGGAYINGPVNTGGGDFVGRDQYNFFTTIQAYIRNPAQWQDDIWQAFNRHWHYLAILLVVEIGLAALFLKYKDLYLIPGGVWMLASALLFASTFGWYFFVRFRSNKHQLMVTIPTSIGLFLLFTWQGWQILAPPKFEPQSYGIAVAELGEGPDVKRTSRAKEISQQIYQQLLVTFGAGAARFDGGGEDRGIKLMSIGVIPNTETAQAYGERINADIVIWGQILTTVENSATIRFEILETPDRAVNPEFPVVLPVVFDSTDIEIPELDLESDPTVLKAFVSQQATIVAKFALGLHAYLNRNYYGAAQNLEAAIAAIGKTAEQSASPRGFGLLYFYIGRSYQGMEEIEQGIDWLLKAEMEIDQSEGAQEPAIPLSLALGYGALGDMENRDKQLEIAMTSLNAWLKIHPNDATALYDRGLIYQIYNQHEYAVLDFETALQFDPDYYITYISLGQSAAKVGDLNKATDMIHKGIQIAEEKGIGSTWARFNLALIYEEAGEIEAARQQYQVITSQASPERWIFYSYGRFLEKISELDSALAAYRKSAEIASRSGIGIGWAYGNLAGFLDRRKFYAEAVENYQIALQAAPEDALLHANLGKVYFIVGEYENARQEFEEAIGLGGTIYYVYAAYGDVLFQMGDYAAAARMYRKSLDLRPMDGAVLLNLALTYLQGHDVEKAAQIYVGMVENSELPGNVRQTACDQLLVMGIDPPGEEECSNGFRE